MLCTAAVGMIVADRSIFQDFRTVCVKLSCSYDSYAKQTGEVENGKEEKASAPIRKRPLLCAI